MKRLLFAILIFASGVSSAQLVGLPIFVQGSYMTGTVMPHRDGMEDLQYGLVQGTELEFGLQMAGNDDWHVAYGYPMTGIGFHYDYLNNPEILGYAAGAYGFIEMPLIRQTDFELMYRLTSGLTYVSELFDVVENPDNIAIATHLNYLFHTGLRARYWMSGETALGLGLGLTHYSNGGTSIPNKGLNQLNVNLSVMHYLQGSYNEYSGVRRPIVWNPNHEVYVMGAFGRVNIGTLVPNVGTNQMYTTISATLGYNYRYAAHRKVGLSLDGFYNESYNWSHWNGFVDHGYDWKTLSRLGMAIQHEFVMKRLSIIIAGGVYLKRYEPLSGALGIKADEWAYERLGFRYYPIENLFLNISVKAYGFKAETIEAGIGFAFQSK